MVDLVFPRLVYRGKQDILGLGTHTDPDTGELVGETKRVNSQDEWDAAQKDGWRLTSPIPEPVVEAPKPAAKEKAAKEKA